MQLSLSKFLTEEKILELLLGWFALLVEVAIFVGRTELVAAAFALTLTCLSAPSKLKHDFVV